jgi:beta-fructofuranosidase
LEQNHQWGIPKPLDCSQRGAYNRPEIYEDLDLRIFIDKYLVEVFVNGRQALLNAYMGYRDSGAALKAYRFHFFNSVSTKIRKIEIWKLKPTNEGFLEARESRNWAPDVE